MDWLLLPRPLVELVAADAGVAMACASLLEDAPDRPLALKTKDQRDVLLNIFPIDDRSGVIGLWLSPKIENITIANLPVVSIWCSRTGPSVLSLDDADRADILRRACQLSLRIWDNQPLPESWHTSRHGGFDSIYAAGFQHFENLRLTYTVRVIGDRRVVDIGSLHRAWRAGISVSAVPVASVAALPPFLQPPDVLLTVGAPIEGGPDAGADRDFVISLPGEGVRHLFSLDYDQWVHPEGPLTRQQRRVINHRVERPLRIHGPAGSGKTLVLILKALWLLREAQKGAHPCHVLLAVTSTAVQATVRTAIEAIDDRGFLATTRADQQFLGIETLHGWCIRELGLESGPGRVLERDPKASKVIQLGILSGVFDLVYSERYDRLKDFLSPDFRARVAGKRDQLLRDFQWEIAIRIKGRGFRRSDRELYIKSPLPSFVGRRENEFDRHFIFHVYEQYEKQFHEERLLDTDDVVLSMAARLGSSLWDRERSELGYDYVLVDETHLFNENERRVLPLMTRGTTEYPLLIMTFDEAQSIGGRRAIEASVGITTSDKKTLTVVHRSGPDIFALARDLVERSPLMFTEFANSESVPRMPERELARCRKPVIVEVADDDALGERTAGLVDRLSKEGYKRVGVISFDRELFQRALGCLQRERGAGVYEVEERGEKLAAVPRSGVYVMTPESCGGLEFDAVVLIGVDEGRVPPSIAGLSAEGYLSVVEESYMELYTAVTRARYVLVFMCDSTRGPSELIRPCISTGLLAETPSD